MVFTAQHFNIRPWRTGDEASLVYNANNKKIWDNVRDRFPHPYTLADAHAWLEFQKEIDPVVNFAIEVEGLAVGGIGLIPGKGVSRISAEIGYWLGEDYWGRGITTEAIKMVVKYGFEELAFKRIFAEVFAFNASSMRALEKAGFEKGAIFKNAIIKNDKVSDTHYFAIYPAQNPQ